MRPGDFRHEYAIYLKYVFKKYYVFIICVISAIEVFPKTRLKEKLTVPI